MPARVSVVVPVYNGAAYLGEALDSVLAQVGAELEVVVVDDGSSDGSAAVAARFAPRVRLLQQPNRGIGAARNAGLAVTGGELVAFLDADDLWPSGSLRALLAAVEGHPGADLAAGRLRCFASPELDADDLTAIQLPAGTASGAGMAGATLMRRAAVERVGTFDESLRVGEMVDWYLRARDTGLVEVLVDEIVLLRRIHRANQGRRRADARVDYLRTLRASLARRRGGSRD